MSVPDYVRLARHELDLNDNGHEDILTSVTTETDTTLVLAPDGVGGVEFRSETGSSTTTSIWRPVMALDPTSGNYLPVTTGVGDAVMVFF